MLHALAARESLQGLGLGRCHAAAKRAVHANRSIYAAGKDQVADLAAMHISGEITYVVMHGAIVVDRS